MWAWLVGYIYVKRKAGPNIVEWWRDKESRVHKAV
jgi:hypothetical protein